MEPPPESAQGSEGLSTLGGAEPPSAHRIAHLNDASSNAELILRHGYAGNAIQTARYTMLTFWPKNLIEFFRVAANIYFLLVSMLQLLTPYSPTNKYSTAGPLIIVFLITVLKNYAEDAKRHQADREMNGRPARILERANDPYPGGLGCWREGRCAWCHRPALPHQPGLPGIARHVPGTQRVRWRDVRVGDILLVSEREELPADIVVLSTAEEEGKCFIETANLDGETNLKRRTAVRPLAERIGWRKAGTPMLPPEAHVQAASALKGTAEYERPNSSLYTFVGLLHMAGQALGSVSATPTRDGELPAGSISGGEFEPDGEAPIPINAENIILRGCTLRSCRYVLGLVVFTGDDTKLMRNSRPTPSKYSNIYRLVNRLIAIAVLLQILLMLVSVVGFGLWSSTNGHSSDDDGNRWLWYLQGAVARDGFIVSSVTFFILYNNLIPISLYVSLDIVKNFQARRIEADPSMAYTPKLGYGAGQLHTAKARTSDINEDLGQVGYVFSDKTGTLTRNMMEFRKCAIGGVAYGFGTTEIGEAAEERRLAARRKKRQLKLKRRQAAAKGERDTGGGATAASSDELLADLSADAVDCDALAPGIPSQQLAKLLSDPDKAQVSRDKTILFDDPRLRLHLANGPGTPPKQAERVRQFLECLVICHTVIPEEDSVTGEPAFRASSPDEEALVKAAQALGFRLVGPAPHLQYDAVDPQLASTAGVVTSEVGRVLQHALGSLGSSAAAQEAQRVAGRSRRPSTVGPRPGNGAAAPGELLEGNESEESEEEAEGGRAPLPGEAGGGPLPSVTPPAVLRPTRVDPSDGLGHLSAQSSAAALSSGRSPGRSDCHTVPMRLESVKSEFGSSAASIRRAGGQPMVRTPSAPVRGPGVTRPADPTGGLGSGRALDVAATPSQVAAAIHATPLDGGAQVVDPAQALGSPTTSSAAATTPPVSRAGSLSGAGRSSTTSILRQRVEVVAVNEFSSARKRMSVVVRNPDGTGTVYCKGADSVMVDLISDWGECSAAFASDVQDAAICEHFYGELQTPRREEGKRPAADSTRTRRSSDVEPAELMQRQLVHFATEGLRTLVLAVGQLSAPELQRFLRQWRAAATAMEDRAERLAEVAEGVETDLAFVGVTAIEDKLQGGVPATIEKLLHAGIKVWVLTGDKMETAINIGYACRLLDDKMTQFSIGTSDPVELHEQLLGIAEYLRDERRPDESVALVIDGSQSLVRVFPQERKRRGTHPSGAGQGAQPSGEAGLCLPAAGVGAVGGSMTSRTASPSPRASASSPGADGSGAQESKEALRLQKELRQLLLSVAQQCSAVVACRVSPAQKAQLVNLVRRGVTPEPVTLAIGDGANDVNMIQTAHVGVGISGQEGVQAVNSSDFAIAQFRFLQPLLLVHGRLNYSRIARVVLYSFYKNVALVFTLFLFNFYNGQSGAPLFESYVQTGWNFFTALPIIAIGIYDHDVDPGAAIAFPGLYRVGQRNRSLNLQLFVRWILNGVSHALLTFYCCQPAMLRTVWGRDGVPESLWVVGSAVYLCLLLPVTAKAMLLARSWGRPFLVGLLCSLLLVTVFVVVYNEMLVQFIEPSFEGVFYRLLGRPVFWFTLMLSPFVAMFLDVLGHAAYLHFWPDSSDALRLALQGHKPFTDLPLELAPKALGALAKRTRRREAAKSTSNDTPGSTAGRGDSFGGGGGVDEGGAPGLPDADGKGGGFGDRRRRPSQQRRSRAANSTKVGVFPQVPASTSATHAREVRPRGHSATASMPSAVGGRSYSHDASRAGQASRLGRRLPHRHTGFDFSSAANMSFFATASLVVAGVSRRKEWKGSSSSTEDDVHRSRRRHLADSGLGAGALGATVVADEASGSAVPAAQPADPAMSPLAEEDDEGSVVGSSPEARSRPAPAAADDSAAGH